MSKVSLFTAVVLFSSAIIPRDARGQLMEVALAELEADYKRDCVTTKLALSEFRDREMKLNLNFRTKLQQLETQIVATQGEVIGSKRLVQIRAMLRWLDGGGDIPRCDLFTQPVCAYAKDLYTARARIDKPLSKLIKALKRDGKDALVAKLDDAYYKLGRILDARESVKPGVKFKGYRQPADSDKQVPLAIYFDKTSEKGEFSGGVERDYPYSRHPHHELVGGVHGLAFKGQTGMSLANPGNPEDLTYSYNGVVIGRALIGEYRGQNGKGKVQGGGFFLTRQ